MKKRALLGVLVASLVLLVASSVASAADSWIGNWTLDVKASKFSPGPAPKSQTLTFENKQGVITLTAHMVDAKGKALHSHYMSKFDGTDVAWTGNPDADMASPKRVDDNSYTNTWKKGGKAVIEAKVMVSEGGKTLTVTQTGTNAKGQAVDNTEVFHRK